MIKLSLKERREQFLFFTGLFVLAVGLLGFGIFYSPKSPYQISKTELELKISENEAFEDMVKETMPTIDTTYKQIIRFDPNVQAVFLKSDIQNSLNSIKSAYERKASDSRYKTFIQTSQLYDILFYDKQEMKGNLRDIEGLKRNLDDCVISRRQLQQTMSTQR
ncbi:type VI secretion system transmembrane protein TssO [Pedobacter nototheniae]|uniref:type VI secretion system transmembrane protein TssO n=1 Tax=Pedobacter nototheniae TaxID=2488994 RepID=UPI00292CAB6C|nr:type VI secretion system transmembrane protein TssO [Pedobacter nototheniae]